MKHNYDKIISNTCFVLIILCGVVFGTYQFATHRNGITLWQFIILAGISLIGVIFGVDTHDKDKTE